MKLASFLAGWRTRLFSVLVALLGVVEMVDPGLVTTAFGLDARGNALILIVIGVSSWILRQITSGPPAPMRKHK